MEIITHTKEAPKKKYTAYLLSIVLGGVVLVATGMPVMNYQSVCNDDACFEAPETIALSSPTSQDIEVPSFLPNNGVDQSLYWSVYNEDGYNLVKATLALDLHYNYQFFVKDVSDDTLTLGSKVLADDFYYTNNHLFLPDGSAVPVEPEYLFHLLGKELDTRVNIFRSKESTNITLTTYRIQPHRSVAENLFFMAHADISGRVFNDFSLTLLKGKLSEDVATQKVQPTNHMICALDADRQGYSRLLNTTMGEMDTIAKKLKKQSRSRSSAKKHLTANMKNSLKVMKYNLHLLTESDEYVGSGVHLDTQLALTDALKKVQKSLQQGRVNFKKAYRMLAKAKKLTSKAKRVYADGNISYVRTADASCYLPDMPDQVMVKPVHAPQEVVPAESEPNIDVA